ncbi:alpha-2-macroglobulin family protein [Breoghania sp.]|uniref:alpha-2-macroglobulin family protein n=1 Tax=Breoghania sp. TaxID=2065378 RepID=UPI002AAB8AB0|nr:alpha-2-macroglobulin family protein [Breoghania sp.]
MDGERKRWVETLGGGALRGIAAFGLSLLLGAGATAAERRIVTVPNADYFGADYRTAKDVDLEACKAICLDDPECKAFTYNEEARWCFLKSDFGDLRSFAGAIAGRVVEVKPQASAQETAQRRAELDYLPSSLRQEADRFAASLATRYDPGSLGLGALIDQAEAASTAGNLEEAVTSFGRALVLAQERSDLWLSMSRAASSASPDDWREKRRMREAATASAVNAYIRAVDDDQRIRALEAMAVSLKARQLWKPAIRSYRAALAIRENARLRADYDAVVAEHGFRITEHKVDSDAASPRICLVFSDKLSTSRPNLADFVAVTGAPGTSVVGEDSQICVDGVRHGARYDISVRPGLPAADGETLEKASDLTVYVRDRSPTVRFMGRAYVLPRGKDPTIPVVTVNTDTLEAEIYRVSDRALADLVRENNFLDQLSSWRTSQLGDDVGSKIWEGTVEVGNELNQDVTTAIPLDDIKLDMTPGAYALVAKVPNDTNNKWGPFATQWFIVSDLGLTTYSGRDGLHVFVRSLSSAKAVADVAVTLVAANNEVLGKAVTDAAGRATFDPGLSRGTGGNRPAVLNAQVSGGDYAFLDLTKAPFDLTDRGVDGRPAPGPIDTYAYTERGVYRPGASVHAVALARDEKANAQPHLPMTFIFTRPDGVEQARIVSADAGLGGHAVDLRLPQSAMFGTWTLAVHADPKGEALSTVNFLVEDFEPERVAFELDSAAEHFSLDEPAEVTVQADYLYGAPAGDMKLEGEVQLRPTRTWTAFKGYFFGLEDEQAYPTSGSLPSGLKTDAEGKLAFSVVFPESPAETQLLEAEIVARLVDAGGRYVERSLKREVLPDGARLGLRPLFDGSVGEGGPAEFNLILADATGKRIAADAITWELSRIETNYQWFRANGSWQFDAVKTTRRVANGTVAVGEGDPARLSLPVDWGRYRLEVTGGPDASATSVEFSAGWYAAKASAETPDVLEVGLDKERYAPGDIAKLRLEPRFSGTALISVMADGLITTKVVEVEGQKQASVELPVTDEWGAGAYVTATLYRPMDLEAKRMPSRAVGLTWLDVDPGDRKIEISLDAPQAMRPNATLTLPIHLANVTRGSEAYVTVAAVDVGILNLTRYEPPAPDDWYFGQRALGMEMRDLYGQLIDRMAGTRGAVRSGGDGMGLRAEGPPPTQKPLALFSGIVKVDEDAEAVVTFDIPDFTGTVKIMAVAWTASGVGHADRDVIVRDPVVASVSLPHFLSPGDTSRMLVELDNVEGPAGTYSLSFTETPEVAIAATDSDLTVELDERQRIAIRVPIEGRMVGDAELSLVINGPDGPVASKTFALGVRDLSPDITRRSLVSLVPGQSIYLGSNMLDGLRPDASQVSFSAGALAGLDVAGLLSSLNRYPYGCTEQLTSAALPLLYLNRVALASGMADDKALEGRVTKALAGVLSNQSSSGDFGVWSPNGSGKNLWLDSYVSDFLTRAREAKFDVPELAYTQALDNLANSLAYASDFETGGEDLAYALYVLTRAGRASIGDIRYYIDTRLDRFATPLAKAQLGAAAALYGEQERAQRAFAAALDALDVEKAKAWTYRADYGSPIRDAAGILALSAEAGNVGVDLTALTHAIAKGVSVRARLSTQDKAWMLMAADALLKKDTDAKLSLDGAALGTPASRIVDGGLLMNAALQLSNGGQEPVDVATTITGPSLNPLMAAGNGFTVTRETYDLDGEPVDASALVQNQRVVVVLRVSALDDVAGRLMLVDPLPAGLEIDNPRLVRSGDLGALDWLALDDEITHSEFRADRFVVTFDRTARDSRTTTFAYMARAVTPGSYARAPAQVEDMYRPERFARTDAERVEVIGPNR